MKGTGRYEIREALGEGGMGIVYRAFDVVMSREVTLKTIRNPQDKTAIDLFKRECSVLASMAHPNIVEIHDVGELDEPGGKRPYLVMPLLKGATLDQLIKSSSTRLTVDRCIHIMSQICRGLQAAHEHGLVHRDLKPSNIFILEDDSVKIIDFGVAHLMDQRTATGLKGTLLYMAPEQLQMKQPTPLADQFSIAVVCYEMLARRHPFSVPGYKDLTQAILHHSPTPIFELSQNVNRLISQVVHKALAKEPVHRFGNMREFADCLQKGFRNETIDIFDPSRLEPRLERVRKAVMAGDLDFAGEVLREIESESYLDPEIRRLRQHVEETQRSRIISQLLETAKRRFEEEEYLLALQKVQDVLNIEPGNTEAFGLKGAIENKRSTTQIEGSLRLAQQHMENRAYDLAREAANKALHLRPKDPRALSILADADRKEQEAARYRQEKEKAYDAAKQDFGHGEVSAALSKLERVLEIERRSPDSASSERTAAYQKFYEQVRSKHDQLDSQCKEAKRLAAEHNLTAALALCDEVLKEFPQNVIFQALKFDLEEARREEISAYIAKVERDVASERDLNRKVAILEEAKQRYPAEERFSQALERNKSRRDLAQAIAGRATALENSGQFAEALAQWEILRNTYPQYPGLDVEIERLNHRREHQIRAEAKAHWVAQIDEALREEKFAKADSLAGDALAEFNNDSELLALKRSAQLGIKRTEDASRRLEEARELLKSGKLEEGFTALREAGRLDPQNQVVRNTLVEAILERARELVNSDWKAAEPLISEALELDPGNPLGKSLRTLMQDKNENEETTEALSKARELQTQGEIKQAIAEVDRGLLKYPASDRLLQLRTTLIDSLPERERAELRVADLQQLKNLADLSQKSKDPKEMESIFAQTRVYTARYSGDGEFLATLAQIESRVKSKTEIKKPAEEGAIPGGPSKKQDLMLRLRLAYQTRLGQVAIGICVGLIGILVFMALRNPRPKAIPPAAVLAKVLLEGQTSAAKIIGNGTEYTISQAQEGLPPGSYTLQDSRPGFKPLKQPIIVGTERVQSVLADWKPLTPAISIVAGPGEWTLDSQPLNGSDLAKIEIPAGSQDHVLAWSDKGQQVTLPFKVVDGVADLGAWSGKAPASLLAVSVRPEASQIRLKSIRGLSYRVGSSDPQKVDKDGVLNWQPPSEQVEFVLPREAGPLMKIAPYDSAQGGMIYVSLRPRVGSVGVRPPPPPEDHPVQIDKGAQTSATVESAKPALTDEELREQRRQKKLQQLNLPKEIITPPKDTTKKGVN